MKKMRPLFALLIVVFFASCSNDDDFSPTPTQEVPGIWNLTAFNYEGQSSVTEQGQTITIDSQVVGQDFDYQMTFAENPNAVTSQGTFTAVIETTILGETMTDTQLVSANDDSGIFPVASSWEIQGNQMILMVDGEASALDIVQLTSSTMKLSGQVTQDVSGVSVSADLNITLEKVQ